MLSRFFCLLLMHLQVATAPNQPTRPAKSITLKRLGANHLKEVQTFSHGPRRILPCSPNQNGCLACFLNACTNCMPSYYLSSTNCISCSISFDNCDLCTSASSCQSCSSGWAFDTQDNRCNPICPLGTFLDHATNTCLNCSANCLDCSNNTDDKDCGRCKPPLVKDIVNGRCVLYQGSDLGFYKDLNISNALPCSIPGAAGCAVYTGLSLHPPHAPLDGFYFDSALMKFAPCDTNAAVCTGGTAHSAQTQVQFCTYGTGLLNNSCVAYFSSGYYDTTTNAVVPGTADCMAFGSTGCKWCASGYSWDPITRKCVPHCLQNQPMNTATLTCSAAIPNCEFITPGINICGKCQPGFYLSGSTCAPCSVGCYYCNSGSQTRCTQCRSGYYGQDLGTNFACLPTCAANQYRSTSFCTSANPSPGCETYGYYTESSQCSWCPPSKRLSSFFCMHPCPLGTYANPGSTSCIQTCNSNCRSCWNPTSTTGCLSCATDKLRVWDPIEQTCTTFYSGSCTPNCIVCSSIAATDCIEPAPGYYLDRNRNVVQYLKSCPIGYFLDGVSCTPCHADCAKCEDATNHCSVCKPHVLRIAGRCISNTNQCQLKQGSRIDFTNPTNLCQACSVPNCLVCSEPATVCEFCKAGYFANTAGNCQTCSSASNTNVEYCHQRSGRPIRCTPGYALLKGATSTVCQKLPDIDEYYDTTAQTVSVCSPDCLGCIGTANNCTMCRLGERKSFVPATGLGSCTTYRFAEYLATYGSSQPCPNKGRTCVKATGVPLSCKDGYYLMSGACTACADACKTCTGPAATECTGCHMGYNLDAGKCIPVCEKYEYLDTTLNICLPCSPHCLECTSGGTYPACTSCLPGEYLSPTSQCLRCPQLCTTCSAADPMACTACVEYAVLDSGTSTCEFRCADGLYLDSGTELCTMCHPLCKTCVGPSPLNCTDCLGGFTIVSNEFVPDIPNVSSGYCKRTCPAGFVNMSPKTINDCVTCSSPLCTDCTGPGVGECTACVTGFYLHAGVCRGCHPSCLTCSGGRMTQCLTCRVGYTLDALSRCSVSCPSGQGFDPNTNNCAACHASCDTCVDTTEIGCLTCKPAYPLFITAESRCLATCPAGTWYSSQACASCDASCSTCTAGQPTDCTTCAVSGNYIQVGSLLCAAGCQGSTYVFSATHCANCHPSCAACSGAASTACTSCRPTDFFTPSLGTCTGACPDFYFETLPLTCAACSPLCKTCTGPAINQCTSCAPTFSVDQFGRCAISCPSGQAFDAATSGCSNCDSTCATCYDLTASNCTSCTPGSANPYFIASTNTCIPSCGALQYYNSSLSSCASCDPSCSSCSGPADTDCLGCLTPEFYIQVSSSRCSLGCEAGTFVGSPTHCAVCDPSCLGCTGPLAIECLTCYTGDFYNPTLKTCSSTCAAGYYGDPATMKCLLCNPTCSTCKGPGIYDCLSCDATRSLSFDGVCGKVCGSGFYFYLPDDSCYLCASACKECFSDTDYDCKQCHPGNFLNHLGNCLSACPNSTYTVSDKCLACSTTCATCTGPGSTDCSSCSSLEVLRLDGSCAAACPEHQFVDSLNKCQKCHDSCSSCRGPSPTDCQECYSPATTLIGLRGDCVDCLTRPESDETTCFFNVPLSLSEVSKRNFNINCSVSVRLSFRNESSYALRVTAALLEANVLVQVSGLDPSVYTKKFVIRNGEMVIDFYFGSSSPTKHKVSAVPKQQVILVNPVSKTPELIFRNQSASYEISVVKAPDSATMDALMSAAGGAASFSSPLAAVGTAMGVLSLLASSGLGGPVMKLVRVFKLISRLRLINVFFGSYLELFLTVCGSLYKIGGDEITSDVVKSAPNSRGKLDLYKVTPFSSEVLAVAYPIYFLCLITRVYRSLIRRYSPNVKDLKFSDRVFDALAEKGRVLVLTLVGIDIIFYSIRSVSHLNLQGNLPTQAGVSYWLSTIAILIMSVDLIMMVQENSFTSFSVIRREMRMFRLYQNRLLGKTLKEPTSLATNNIGPQELPLSLLQTGYPEKKIHPKPDERLSQGKMQLNQTDPTSNSPPQKPNRILRSKKRTGILMGRNTKEEGSVPQQLKTPLPLPKTVEPKLQVNAFGGVSQWPEDCNSDARLHPLEDELDHEIQGELNSSPNALRRMETNLRIYIAAGRHTAHKLTNPTSEQFFGNGIKLYKLRTFEGRYFNSFSLMKIVIFEPFYITMQMFPSGQISLLLILQLAYTVWTARAGFKGIFASRTYFISTLFNELALTVFLITGTIFQLGGGESNFSDSKKTQMQFTAIGFLTAASVIGLVEFFVSLALVCYTLLKNRKVYKYIEQQKKAREEKNLVRVRQAGEGSPSKTRKQQVAAADSPWTDKQGPGQAPYDDPSNSSGLKMLDMSDLPGDDFSPAGDEQQPKGMLPQDQTTNNKGLRRRRLVTGAARTKK